jgi:hypothetical protein
MFGYSVFSAIKEIPAWPAAFVRWSQVDIIHQLWLSFLVPRFRMFPHYLPVVESLTDEMVLRGTLLSAKVCRLGRQGPPDVLLRQTLACQYSPETRWNEDKRQLCVCVCFFLISWGGVRLSSPLGTSATNWPIVPSQERWWRMWNSQWNENWHGKPKYSEKIYPIVTFFHHKSHMTWPGLKPGSPRWEAGDQALEDQYGTGI